MWEEFTEVDSGTADQNNKSEDIIRIPHPTVQCPFSCQLSFSIRKFQFVLLVALDSFHKIGKRSWKQLVLFQANISRWKAAPLQIYVFVWASNRNSVMSHIWFFTYHLTCEKLQDVNVLRIPIPWYFKSMFWLLRFYLVSFTFSLTFFRAKTMSSST